MVTKNDNSILYCVLIISYNTNKLLLLLLYIVCNKTNRCIILNCNKS